MNFSIRDLGVRETGIHHCVQQNLKPEKAWKWNKDEKFQKHLFARQKWL